MISLYEAIISNNISTQPQRNLVNQPQVQQQVQPQPNLVNQQQVVQPNSQLNINNTIPENPPVGQQQNFTQPTAFDWKKILKPLAIGGAAIGTLGLAHAAYNGNLPSLGFAHLGGGDDSVQDNSKHQTEHPAPPRKHNADVYAQPGSAMKGPPPQEHIPQKLNIYRQARPMLQNPNQPSVGLMYNNYTPGYPLIVNPWRYPW